MIIEEGKSYRDREGQKHGPMLRNKSPIYPEHVYCAASNHKTGFTAMCWRDDGSWHTLRDTETRHDLVAEWVEHCDLGHHERGPGDVCTICGATREQVDAQAKAAMCDASHAAAEQREQMGHGMGDPVALTEERKSTHGNWTDQAVVGVMLDQAVQDSPGYTNLAAYQRKAVDMILVKVSRIVSGDPGHADHWDDIAGYAYLGKDGHNSA